jgi:hypothetical protein
VWSCLLNLFVVVFIVVFNSLLLVHRKKAARPGSNFTARGIGA